MSKLVTLLSDDSKVCFSYPVTDSTLLQHATTVSHGCLGTSVYKLTWFGGFNKLLVMKTKYQHEM